MKRDYKKRIKKGYKEIDLCIDLISNYTITIEEEEKNANKRVFINDKYGKIIRTSNIFLGKNIYEHQLKNTEYLPLKEIKKELKKIFTFENGEEIYTRNTKEGITSEEAIQRIIQNLKNSGELLIGTQNKNIRNQNTAKLYIKGTNQTHFIKKGVLMLGNKGIELPCGEYISRDELEKALYDFIVLKPKRKPLLKRRKKHKKKWHLWPMALAGTIIASMGINVSNNEADEEISTKCYEYTAKEIKKEPILETPQETAERVLSQFEIGQKINIKTGTEYHTSSDYQYVKEDSKGVIGSDLRPEGDYKLEKISVIEDGCILKTEDIEGENLYNVLNNTSNEYMTNYENMECVFHLTSPETGWIDAKSILDASDFVPEEIGMKTMVGKEYSGVIENFDGTITLEDTENTITLENVTMENLMQNGGIIEGNDHQEYQINLRESNEHQQIENDAQKVNWTLKNIQTKKAFLIGALGILTSVSQSRKEIKKKVLKK